MSFEWPDEYGELSTWALDHAVETLEKLHEDDEDGDAKRALATIRLVVAMPRAAPWWGQQIRKGDSSVDVGMMMRNMFEGLGDHIEIPTDKGLETIARHYLTQRYLPDWRAGRAEYYDFLDHLADPLQWEADQRRRTMSTEEADAAYRRLGDARRNRP